MWNTKSGLELKRISLKNVVEMESPDMCVEATVHWFQMDSNLPKVGSFQILSSHIERVPTMIDLLHQPFSVSTVFTIGWQNKSNCSFFHLKIHLMRKNPNQSYPQPSLHVKTLMKSFFNRPWNALVVPGRYQPTVTSQPTHAAMRGETANSGKP